MYGLVGLALRRWLAALLAILALCGLLLWPSAAPWLRVVGAAAASYLLFCACAQWRVGSAFGVGRVRVEDRAVLITGCDSGFGLEAARRLHAAGVGRVFACVLDDASKGAEALRALQSHRLCVLPCDVTDAGAISSAAEAVKKELLASGRELWALINNAGVLGVGESEWVRIEDIKKAIDVNALGQVRMAQTFLPLLRKTKGRVINVNSLASRLVGFFLTPYTISKFASLAFTDSLRQEMKKFSISVHSIEPWIVKNDLGKSFIPLMLAKLDEVPNELKKEYSKDYADKVQSFYDLVLRFFAMPETASHLVVDAIEDACLSNYPEDRYLPGNLSKLADSFRGSVAILQDYFVKYYFH